LRLHRLPHHLGVLLEALDLHLCDNHPVALRADVSHDAHRAESSLPAELIDGEEFLNHRSCLSWFAKHDVSDKKHGASSVHEVSRRYYHDLKPRGIPTTCLDMFQGGRVHGSRGFQVVPRRD